jgi:hypothetical protein
MVRVRSAPSHSGLEVRTFECAKCGRDKIVEAIDPAAYVEDRRRVLATIEMCMHQRYSLQLRVQN